MNPARQPNPARSFFDKRAADYDREYGEQTAGGYALRVRREKVLQLFDQPGGKVLDVGCGPGVMAQDLINRDCRFWGVDASEKMLEICRRRFSGNERTRFLCGDTTRLALPGKFFDAVLCMGVIDGVPDRRAAVQEMLRVLRPGGTLIVTFTNLASPYSWWKRYVFYPAVAWYQSVHPSASSSGKRFTGAPDAKSRTLYNKREARALLESEGAEGLEMVSYYFNIFLSPLDEIFPRLALRVTRALEEHRFPRPDWIASGWIIKASKGTKGAGGLNPHSGARR